GGGGAGGGVAARRGSRGAGAWEDESPRTFGGMVVAEPYALLRTAGPSPEEPVRTILLVGEGKFGAAERVRPFAGRPARVTGTLLHRQGRWMVELASGPEGVQPLDRLPEAQELLLREGQPGSLGRVERRGEFVDPKCYLGAMKPGAGKTHKACAALCISGGIPPMLVTRGADGGETFYLLTDHEGGPCNDLVLPFVTDPVEVSGELEQVGDLRVLRVAPGEIRRR